MSIFAAISFARTCCLSSNWCWCRRSINQQMSVIMIKTKVFLVSPYSVYGVVYSIQHYGIKCDLWLAIGRWFSLGNPVSSNNKADCRHDIAEILLKVALNTITLTHPLGIGDIILFFQFFCFDLPVPDECYPRNESCALNQISYHALILWNYFSSSKRDYACLATRYGGRSQDCHTKHGHNSWSLSHMKTQWKLRWRRCNFISSSYYF